MVPRKAFAPFPGSTVRQAVNGLQRELPAPEPPASGGCPPRESQDYRNCQTGHSGSSGRHQRHRLPRARDRRTAATMQNVTIPPSGRLGDRKQARHLPLPAAHHATDGPTIPQASRTVVTTPSENTSTKRPDPGPSKHQMAPKRYPNRPRTGSGQRRPLQGCPHENQARLPSPLLPVPSSGVPV